MRTSTRKKSLFIWNLCLRIKSSYLDPGYIFTHFFLGLQRTRWPTWCSWKEGTSGKIFMNLTLYSAVITVNFLTIFFFIHVNLIFFLTVKSTVINMSRGHKDLEEIRETLVIMERGDRKDIEGSLVCRVFLDLQ